MKNETQSALVARDAAIILLLIWAFMQALLMIWAPADTQTTYLLLLFLMDIAVLCGFMDRVNTGTALAATITCGWVAYKLYSFYAVGETVYLTDYFVTVLPLLGSGAAALFSRSMRRVNAENKLLRRQVDEQVLVDDVTELYNLRAMYRDAQMMTGYCVRNHLPISLMIIQMRYESELHGMLSHSRYIQLRKRLAELVMDSVRVEDKVYCIDEHGTMAILLTSNEANSAYVRSRIIAAVTKEDAFDGIQMHIAIVKAGASYRIYADGLLVAEAESPADSYDGTLLIGVQRDADGNIFRISQTQVNHLSVYAGVMAEADIAAYDFADAPLPPELVAESAAYTMPGAFVGNGSDRALDTGVKLYDVATKDWTLDTVIDVRKGVNNGVYMSCFSEEIGHYRGFMLRQDNADTLTAYVGNSVGVTVDLPQGTSLMHLVVVKSGSQYTIWQDGELVQRVESDCDNYDATLLLGAQRDADGNLFRFSNAGIRTLNITDGALSDTDAATLSAPVKDNSRF